MFFEQRYLQTHFSRNLLQGFTSILSDGKKNCSIAIFSITRLEWGKKTLPSLFGKHFRFKQRTQGFKSIAFQEIRLHSLDAENFLSITKRCFSEIEAAGFENTFFHTKREESYINSFESNNYYEILKTLYKILIK